MSLPFTRLLIATSNAKKLREFESLLAALDVELVKPADLGGLPEVDEDQPTFAANAAKKAVAAAKAKKLWALADDSGLEVDALEGAPGVLSARYAGEPCDDAANNAKLLAALSKTPTAKRGARFVCALRSSSTCAGARSNSIAQRRSKASIAKHTLSRSSARPTKSNRSTQPC